MAVGYSTPFTTETAVAMLRPRHSRVPRPRWLRQIVLVCLHKFDPSTAEECVYGLWLSSSVFLRFFISEQNAPFSQHRTPGRAFHPVPDRTRENEASVILAPLCGQCDVTTTKRCHPFVHLTEYPVRSTCTGTSCHRVWVQLNSRPVFGPGMRLVTGPRCLNCLALPP